MIDAAREHLQNGIHGFRRSHPQPLDETALDAPLRQITGHLLASAVDHHHLRAPRARLRDLARQRIARFRRIQQGAAQFDQNLHSSPSVSAYPSIRFMFCTACPAAPLTRLSMALTTTARRVAWSTVTPISQKLVRCTARRSGTRPAAYVRTNGSPLYRFWYKATMSPALTTLAARK